MRRTQPPAVAIWLVVAPLTLIALWNDFFVHDWRHDPVRGLMMRVMRATGLLQDTAVFLCLLTAGLWGARAARRPASAEGDVARLVE